MFTIAAITTVMIASINFHQPIAKFDLQHLAVDFQTAELQFNEVKHTKNSFELRVFLNQPDANANTNIEENEHFAGSLYFYGQGEYLDSNGQEATLTPELDLSPGASNTSPFPLYLDITTNLRKIAPENSELTVKLVAVDAHGNEISDQKLDIASISLVTN